MNINIILSNVIIPIIILVIGISLIITLIIKTINNHIVEENRKVKKEETKNKQYKDLDTSIIYKEMNLDKIKDNNADIIKKTMFDMYKALMKAYCNKDKKLLEQLTNKFLYNTYLEKIDKLDKDYELEVIKNITLNDIRILDIKKTKKDYTIKFYLNINCYNYKVDKKSKITMSGYDDRKINQELLIYLQKNETNCFITKITKVGQKVMPKEKKNVKKK